VAATVGDVDITHAEVATRADLFTFLADLSQQPCGAPVEGETIEAACARFALGNLVQAEVTGGYARANGIELDPQSVGDAIAGFESSLPTPGGLERQLEAAGLARVDLEDLASDALLGQEVANAVTEERVGEDVLRREYDARLLQLTTVRVLHILVETESQANGAYVQVTAPDATEGTFMDLAREVSIDPGSAEQGGALGSGVASQYVPEFGEAAAALEPGEISRPVQSEFGWHVIRMVEKQVTPFSEAKDGILRELAGTEFLGWFKEQVRELDVKVNPRYGRFDPQTLQVEAVRSTDPQGDAAAPTGGTGTIQPP